LGNPEEMDIFLHIYNLSKLNQEDINNVNRSITSNKTEVVIKSLPKRKPWIGWIHC
jgi:hypothetical protein